VQAVRAGTLQRLLTPLAFFKGWDAAAYRGAESGAALLQLDAGEQLLGLGQIDPYDYFLLDGTLALRGTPGDERRLVAGDVDAGYPVAHLRPSRYAVTAGSPVRVLRFESSHLKSAVPRRRAARFTLDDRSTAGTWQQHPLVNAFTSALEKGRVELPTLPSIAERIRRAVAGDDFDMGKLATIIGADPAIAARLIQVANSATFRGESKCESLQAALVRLGAERAQNIVTSLALRGLYSSDSGFVKARLKAAWQHAVEIAALTTVLARLSPGLTADRALLVGLLHEIGVIPLLKMAVAYPDLERTSGLLDDIVGGLVGDASATILTRWGFQQRFIDAALYGQMWYRDEAAQADYTDLVIVAHLHALVRRRNFDKLPRLDETPAFGKLAVGNLSPQLSLLVLDESKTKIQELKALLG
jgi:HD-like signal output (HDOD) protein